MASGILSDSVCASPVPAQQTHFFAVINTQERTANSKRTKKRKTDGREDGEGMGESTANRTTNTTEHETTTRKAEQAQWT